MRVFKLRLAEGVQTFRLDEDSVDYDWKGQSRDFHGTLPYENLRLKMRIARKDKGFVNFGLLGIAVIVAIVLLFSARLSHYSFLAAAVLATNLGLFAVRQHLHGGTICFQIEPKVFGFAGEMPVPNTKKGRRFLDELEAAWSQSLRRRFLVADVDPALRLQRIHWLQLIGVLTKDEAAAERLIVEAAAAPEPQLIEGFAVN